MLNKIKKEKVCMNQEKVLERTKLELKEPPLYNVIMFNDDITTMDFVVQVLIDFFYYDKLRAIRTMQKIHNEGKAIIATLPRSIAETKKMIVDDASMKYGFPLKLTIEPEDN